MNKQILAYILILTSILYACRDIDEPLIAGVDDSNIISLNVTVADNVNSGDPHSRAIDKGMSTFFEPGDSVGLIVLDRNGDFIVNNAKYILSDNYNWKFQRTNNRTPFYDSEMQTYIVYYPYDKSVTGANCRSAEDLLALDAFKHQEDQTSKAAYRSSDVMAWEWSDGPIKEIKAELRHLRNCVSLDISVRWTLLTEHPRHFNNNDNVEYYEYEEEENENEDEDEEGREIITFKIPNEAAIKDKDGNLLKTHQADDGSLRFILPDGYEGEVTYYYNYRDLMFKGSFEIQPSETGTNYFKYETVDMEVYTFDQVIVGDYYCKNSRNHGFVLPCEATKYLDNDNHRCIGLVFYTGQHDYDNGSDYSQTGIDDSSCHGYVLALTDVQNDLNNMFEWELNDFYLPYDEENIRALMYVNNSPDDWGGYYNTLTILNTCKENEWYTNFYPAVYAAYYYGNLATGTYIYTDPDTEKELSKTILFNNRDENTPSGGEQDAQNPYAWQEPLQAPENTSGWYLPGNGMLIEFRKYKDLFEKRYEEIKEKLADSIPYKEHIGWLKYDISWRGVPYYWSSTESNFEGRALSHEYSTQNYTYPSHKSYPYAVRAVLAY
ncbi:MAG: fimbrillin family protein [Muribaculaceae bacterium]|nr:fimbrillin family protein [Muribaculaceae bacterium]